MMYTLRLSNVYNRIFLNRNTKRNMLKVFLSVTILSNISHCFDLDMCNQKMQTGRFDLERNDVLHLKFGATFDRPPLCNCFIVKASPAFLNLEPTLNLGSPFTCKETCTGTWWGRTCRDTQCESIKYSVCNIDDCIERRYSGTRAATLFNFDMMNVSHHQSLLFLRNAAGSLSIRAEEQATVYVQCQGYTVASNIPRLPPFVTVEPSANATTSTTPIPVTTVHGNNPNGTGSQNRKETEINSQDDTISISIGVTLTLLVIVGVTVIMVVVVIFKRRKHIRVHNQVWANQPPTLEQVRYVTDPSMESSNVHMSLADVEPRTNANADVTNDSFANPPTYSEALVERPRQVVADRTYANTDADIIINENAASRRNTANFEDSSRFPDILDTSDSNGATDMEDNVAYEISEVEIPTVTAGSSVDENENNSRQSNLDSDTEQLEENEIYEGDK